MTTTQQLPASPAQRFADKIRARTNNGQDLIDLLHDISKGGYDANKNDRVTAANYLTERVYGKCPKMPPAPDPESAEPDNHTSHSSDTPQTDAPQGGPESPRLVTQVEDALNDSLGPPPSAHQHTRHSGGGRNPEEWSGASPHPQSLPRTGYGGEGQGEGENFDPSSIQASIQAYIIEITNDGDTLIDTLMEIAYADDDDTTVTSYHRTRAGRILADRILGTDPNAVRNAVCPDCRQKWSTDDGSTSQTETHPKKKPGRRMSKVDPEALAKARAEIQRMKDEGILTPDPNAEKIDISSYLPPQDFDLSPYAKEEAAKFWANVELRLERQKQWPEIEERRRKKLEQIYPSHSEDDKPPDP